MNLLIAWLLLAIFNLAEAAEKFTLAYVDNQDASTIILDSNQVTPMQASIAACGSAPETMIRIISQDSYSSVKSFNGTKAITAGGPNLVQTFDSNMNLLSEISLAGNVDCPIYFFEQDKVALQESFLIRYLVPRTIYGCLDKIITKTSFQEQDTYITTSGFSGQIVQVRSDPLNSNILVLTSEKLYVVSKEGVIVNDPITAVSEAFLGLAVFEKYITILSDTGGATHRLKYYCASTYASYRTPATINAAFEFVTTSAMSTSTRRYVFTASSQNNLSTFFADTVVACSLAPKQMPLNSKSDFKAEAGPLLPIYNAADDFFSQSTFTFLKNSGSFTIFAYYYDGAVKSQSENITTGLDLTGQVISGISIDTTNGFIFLTMSPSLLILKFSYVVNF